jgi:hypothetical protein
MKIIKKILKTLLLILVTLVTLVLLAWSVLHIAKYFMYPDYYHNAEVLSPIPSLNEGFVPQGLDYDPETNTYIHSGYNGKNVEIYLVTDGKAKEIVPLNPDGTRATGHAGGVTRAGDYLYVCDNENEGDGRLGLLRIFKFDELMNADEIIVSSSGSLCLAAEEVDGKSVGGKAPELLKKLQDEVLREFMEETN